MDQRAERLGYPRMTDAEFRIARHSLGVSQDWLARHLKVTEKTVRNWEDGRYQIPAGVADAVGALLAGAEQGAARLLEPLKGIETPTVYTYRVDRDYYDAHPDGTYCAGWHRAVTARAAARRPGLVVCFYTRAPHLTEEQALQLRDVLAGVYIDAAARSAPEAFLIGEIEDCWDDASGESAYPELLAEARTWSRGQAAALLAGHTGRHRNRD